MSGFDAKVVIDLDHLAHNFNQAAQAAPQSNVMAVVKADAYGHGALPVANALSHDDAFAVARVKEAIELREAGFNHPITLLEGVITEDGARLASDYDLAVVIHDPAQLRLLKQVTLSCWFKVETGMNRLGLLAHQLEPFMEIIPSYRQLGLFSHFSDADKPFHEKNQDQRRRFDALRLRYDLPGGMSGSAAILGGHGTDLDWVRPGIMLYGINPFLDRDTPLLPVMTFKAPVIAVRAVDAGETVGYGSTWVADRPTKLAVIAAGYADGYPRQAPSGTPVALNGHLVHIAGRISMDMMTVSLPDEVRVEVGDWAELWGASVPVEDIGLRCNTIAYTLVCGVGPRVDRVYTGQAEQ